MVIEFNLQHIMILLQLEQLLYVEMEPIALVGIDEGHALIMVEWQDGYDYDWMVYKFRINMKSFLMSSVLFLFVSISMLNAQPVKHMKFMGIPIDGNAISFCQKLKEKGFSKDVDDNEGNPSNAYCFKGNFYGEDAHIQVDYTHDSHTVYSVTVYIIKRTALALYPIQRDYLKAVEAKYRFKKKVINPQLYQYDYYIFDGFDPIGLIQTFIIDSNTIESTKNAMLSISYVDVENYLKYENRKRNDI